MYAHVCVRNACMWLSGRSSIVREIGQRVHVSAGVWVAATAV